MKFSALSRTGFAVALSAVLASMAAAPAHAELNDSIFAKTSPSIRDRMFFRINYVAANVKTTSGEAYDVTGPVVSRGTSAATSDVVRYLGRNSTYVSPYYNTCGPTVTLGCGKGVYQQLGTTLYNSIQQDVDMGYIQEAAGLGTPQGIKAKSQENVGTPAVSLGYFFDDDLNWFFEALLLAAPLKVTVQGDGVNGYGAPNGINGKDIIKVKLLPPTVYAGKYFGKKGDVVRPFFGIGASYALFFDVKATDALNEFVGGASRGDTTVKLKNVLGIGPFLGFRSQLTDDWYLGLTVGKLRYKTEATITTRNTTITSDSAVVQGYGPNVNNAISEADSRTLQGYTPTDPNTHQAIGVSTALMCDLAAAKGISNTCNLGTYVRKQSTVLDNTMLMFSVGRAF